MTEVLRFPHAQAQAALQRTADNLAADTTATIKSLARMTPDV